MDIASHKVTRLLSKLARYRWVKNAAGNYAMDHSHIDTRDKARQEFMPLHTAVVDVLTKAGAKESVDFTYCNAVKFNGDDMVKHNSLQNLTIQYVLILNPELNSFLDNALHKQDTRKKNAR